MEIDAKNLIIQLKALKDDGYIFRGHADADWQLRPRVFRDEALAKAAALFPVEQRIIEEQWFKHEKIEAVSTRNLGDNAQHRAVFRRVLQLYIHVMRYNYWLHCFFNEQTEKIDPSILQNMDRHDKDWWGREESFHHILFNTALLDRWFITFSQKGSIIMPRNPDEMLTALDETFPQHYGVPTAALDWSYNPDVAIYFSLGDKNDITFTMSPDLDIVQKNPVKSLSIFAYKKLTDVKNTEIFQIEAHPSICNERAQKQQGTFLCFGKPSTFYVDRARFPCIDDYVVPESAHESFSLKRFDVKRNESNLSLLEKHLDKYGINKEFLKI